MKLGTALTYMDIHKSSYAYKSRLGLKRKRPYVLDHSLEEALKELRGYELTLGYDKTTTYIRDRHRSVWNRKKVYLHMKALKLLQPKKIKRRWIANKRLPISCAIASNVRWEADLTFVPTQTGHAYLFAVEDVYDREALSGHMDLQCGAAQAIAALREALDRRFGVGVGVEGLRLTVRVDRGCQFTAEAFETFARSRGVELEFCGVQTPRLNIFLQPQRVTSINDSALVLFISCLSKQGRQVLLGVVGEWLFLSCSAVWFYLTPCHPRPYDKLE